MRHRHNRGAAAARHAPEVERSEVGIHSQETAEDHEEMLRSHRERFLWTYFTNIALGLWLLAAPVTFTYENDLSLSDAISGGLIVIFGVLALFPRLDFWARWGICITGLWLLFAPLVFWTHSPAAYANDSIVGGLVVGFSVLVPMMPGKAHHMAMMLPGPDIPPGWTYNPSTWWQRGPIIGLGLVSFLISRYLAAYQLGHIDSAWDPFFGHGTQQILDSDVSRAWPISDAGLGAVAYLIEALSGFMGNVRRWRTMPWMVLMFGVLVVPLGVTSIILVILQPLMVSTWCTLCLLTAAFMLAMIPLAIDEVVAMFQFLLQARREGQPLWRVFWAGGTLRGDGGKQEANGTIEYMCPMHPDVVSSGPGSCPQCGMALEPKTPAQDEGKDLRSPAFDSPAVGVLPAMVWGVTVPWNLLLTTALGLWIMAAPDVLGSSGTGADSDHLVGALIVVVSVIAMAEVVRACRFLNLALALWLLIAAWVLDGNTTASLASDVAAGVLLLMVTWYRGPRTERFGAFEKYVV